MFKLNFLLIAGFLIFIIPVYSQVIYTPITSGIYSYLERIADKGIIENYYSMAKPLSRNEIANYLKVIEKKSYLLSEVEKKELKWFENDYSHELNGKFNRWRLFQYADTLFRIYVTPIVDLKLNSIGGEKNYKRGWLGRFDGSIGKNVGFSFSITDNSEWGDTVDAYKRFSPLTGFSHKTAKDRSISYEDINATLNYSWSWGTFTLGKDYINWGSGREGQIILSSKAPSFPFIKFDIKPVSWLRFQYIHGWLASNLVDSLSIYESTDVPGGKAYYRENQRSKYIAANFLSVIPWKNFVFSLGNSIIYSDGGVRIPFLIPFIWYYKGIDHNFYNSTKNDAFGNNGQLFFDLSIRSLAHYHFYSTLFIDELSFTDFLKGNYSHNQTGYTVGVTNYGSLIDNILLQIEYTKIMPGTYLNYIQTQTYENDSYTLGHWIGQNADYLYTGINYELYNEMDLGVYYKMIRKGGDQLGTDRPRKGMSFLYKPLTEYNIFGINYSYEPLYDLNVKAYIDFTEYSYDNGISPLIKMNSTNLGLEVSYGIY